MAKEIGEAKIAIRKEDYQVLKEVIVQLEKDPNAEAFLQPVDWKALGILDYPSVIKSPMDLSTLKKNLLKGKYQELDAFLADMTLIWTNCRTYNRADSYIS